jgi:HK97 family phage portal protein
MGLWKNLFGWGRKDGSVGTSIELLRQIYGGVESKSGVSISTARALNVTDVQACCKVIAEGFAQVPWRVYREVNGSRSVASDHPLHRIISRRPNRWQTSFEFRETVAYHLTLCGNAFVFVGRVGSNREIRELVPIDPGRVTVRKLDGDVLEYEIVADNGLRQVFPKEAIWQLRGPSWNGWMGMDAVRLAREAIGLAIATEESHATLHKNGAKVSGTYTVKDALPPEKFAQLAAWLDRHSIGGDRENKPLVLDLGADFKNIQMNGVDAQHLETRKHQIGEICRAFRVMPIMIGHAGDQAPTFASAEQFFLAHVVHTLTPWYTRAEQSADINLLGDADLDAGYYTKFTPNALMRGAAADRGSYFAQGLGAGGHPAWLTPNDVRDLEDMERSTDPNADTLFYPAASTAGQGTDAPPIPQS